MNYSKRRITSFIYLLLGIVVVLGGYFAVSAINLAKNESGHGKCLTENQEAYYTVVSDARPAIITVSVRDTLSSTTLWTSKQIEIPNINNVDFYHAQKCNFYVHSSYNYDYQKSKALENYSFKIEKYPYFESSLGKAIVTIQEGPRAVSTLKLSTQFLVDPSEKYIVLINNYMEDDDYSLVIREIDSGKEVYSLYLRDVMKDHPNVFGSFRPEIWKETPEGNYLHGTIFEGPRWSAFFIIKSDTWETEILPTPDNYRGGVERAGTIDGGYLAYTDQTVWTGIDVVYEAVMEKQLAEGKPKNLFVANLRTGEIRTIESVPLEKEHRFNLKWQGTTLIYVMPDGTVKTFTPDF